MKIAIRVDASDQIGTGHLMRCLTLADVLLQQGAKLHFVSRHMPSHLQKMVCEHGHGFTFLEASHTAQIDELDHAKWLGASQEDDAHHTKRILGQQEWDWLIVDHYALDTRWESALRSSVKKIMAIDDLADRSHDCDVLFDQNLYSDMHDRYIGKVPVSAKLLLGPRYALLRPEFENERKNCRVRNDEVTRVLVFFGGIDVENYTGRSVAALSSLQNKNLRIDVVIGFKHPQREEILRDCAKHEFVCHVQTDRMAELMRSADISIGAGGGALWERCCLGLPTLAFSVADNQTRQIMDAANIGLVYAPTSTVVIKETIARHVVNLIENPALRKLLSTNCMQAVDGQGAKRIVAALGLRCIAMRVATFEDARNLFNWRNDFAIREVSLNTDLISWEDHQYWLNSVLSDPNRALLIGMLQDISIGVVRYDISDCTAEISIYLTPDHLGSGLGMELLLAAETWLQQEMPAVCCIQAHILSGNVRSLRLFVDAGFATELTRLTKRLT